MSRARAPLTLARLRVLRARMQARRARFRRLGLFDATIALRCGAARFVVVFEGFECVAARIAGADDCDFALEGAADAWRCLLRGAGGPGVSLFGMVTMGGGIRLRCTDPARGERFFRGIETLEAFFALANDRVPPYVVPSGPAPGAQRVASGR